MKYLLGKTKVDPEWKKIPGMQYRIKERSDGEGLQIQLTVDNGKIITFSPEFIVSQIFEFVNKSIEEQHLGFNNIVINVCDVLF